MTCNFSLLQVLSSWMAPVPFPAHGGATFGIPFLPSHRQGYGNKESRVLGSGPSSTPELLAISCSLGLSVLTYYESLFLLYFVTMSHSRELRLEDSASNQAHRSGSGTVPVCKAAEGTSLCARPHILACSSGDPGDTWTWAFGPGPNHSTMVASGPRPHLSTSTHPEVYKALCIRLLI